jgi:pimeloyl-ACP methyl ester carboxylesterase
MSISSSEGVELAVHDLGGRGPTLLVSHATGFHGRCYLPLAGALADRFHTIAFDYRGHGDTALPDDPSSHFDWERYGDDAQAIATSLRDHAGGPIVAFGHSMGGTCLLMAAHRDPSLFDRLVLFEPIVFPPRPPDEDFENPHTLGARRRRSTFASYDEAVENYAAKPPLSSFTPQALEAYVRYGFAEGDDGTVRLKCAPETEAGTFQRAGFQHTWDVLGQIDTPVMVIAGRLGDMQPSSMAVGVVDLLPNATLVQRDDLDHFGPMTDPAAIASLVSDFVSAGHD